MKRVVIIIPAAVATIGIAALAVVLVVGNPLAAYARPLPPTAHAHQVRIRGAAAKAAPTDLVYEGGAVETTPVIYISWWGTQWNTGFSTGGYTSAQAQTYITDFFTNVGGSSWDNINTQYCQGVTIGATSCGGGGTHVTNPVGQLAGTWVDTTSVPRTR